MLLSKIIHDTLMPIHNY